MAQEPSDQIDTAPERLESESAKPRFGSWLSSILIIFLAYILSIVPAAYVVSKGTNRLQLFTIVYSPLATAATHSRQVNRLLEWYVRDIWRVQLYFAPFPMVATVGSYFDD